MAKAAEKSGRVQKGHSKGSLLALILVMFIFSILFAPTALLLAIGMLPAVVAYIIDDDRKKSLAITVALMNAAGVVPYVIQLWKRGQSLHESFNIIHEPMVWLFMYGAAAMGWLIIYSVPAVVQALLTHRANARIADIDRRHADLAAQWGDAVKPQKHNQG